MNKLCQPLLLHLLHKCHGEVIVFPLADRNAFPICKKNIRFAKAHDRVHVYDKAAVAPEKLSWESFFQSFQLLVIFKICIPCMDCHLSVPHFQIKNFRIRKTLNGGT